MSLDAVLAIIGLGLIYAGGFLYHLENQARTGLMIPCHRHPPGKYSKPAFWVLLTGLFLFGHVVWPFLRILWPTILEVFLR